MMRLKSSVRTIRRRPAAVAPLKAAAKGPRTGRRSRAAVELHDVSRDEGVRDAEPLVARPAGASAVLDPLTAYNNEIRHYAVLSREEEHDLAVRFRDTHDQRVADRLLKANLRLVVKLAHEYKRAYPHLNDLVQEGNVGLLMALGKYDPDRGVKLSSYAAWWIRAYMLKFILDNWRLVRLGKTEAQRKLFFGLRKEKERLAAQGIEPSAERVAANLNVSTAEVRDMEGRLESRELSLDTPLGDEDDRSHLDLLEGDSDDRPDVAAEDHEFRVRVRAAIEGFGNTLVDGRERDIFRDRLLNEAPETLEQIGARHGISRERARQVEAKLKARLKSWLATELGGPYSVAA